MRIRTAAWFLLLGLWASIVHAETGTEAEFARAYRHFAAGEHAAAEPLFRNTLSDDAFVLKDYALYYLGRIAAGAHRHGDARRRFTRLRQAHPRSVWANEASFELIDLDLAQGRHKAAAQRAGKIRKGGRGKTVRARAAYSLGRAREVAGRDSAAYALYQEARRRAPRTPWSGRAKQRVRELRRKHPRELGLKTGQEMLREARQLRHERDYEAAASLYRRILRETNYRRLSLEGLAEVYRKLRLRAEEEEVLRRYVRHYPRRARAGEALTRIATIQWNRNDDDAALKTLRRFMTRHPGHLHRRYAIYVTGRIHESMGRWQDAARTYRQLFAKEHRYSKFRGDAAWRLAWMQYLRADYAAARKTFHDITGRRGNFRQAAVFWEARTAERLKDGAGARRLYRRVIGRDGESYYAILASRRLAELGETLPEPSSPKRRSTARAPALGERAKAHLARARALARMGLDGLAHAELGRVRRHSKRTARLRLLLMREYARTHAYGRSLSLAVQAPLSAETLRFRYPLAYWDAVRRNAAENAVEPYLVLSLMRQESLFKPRAVSHAQAMGLMQLLHETARKEASKMGLPEPEAPRLLEPELNIRLGVHHLKGLLEHYGGSRAKALAAYNAGKEAVERWTRDLGDADDDEFIERISYGETRRYVKAVLRNYHAYRTLYGDAPPADRS
ncbi:MAG: transglycosylase SLT domain-containing protein [Deltaproteobacteria bacterium]|nr:transglycosylase SLT domain-containing protein [Deltaproteobacteria bacterium]